MALGHRAQGVETKAPVRREQDVAVPVVVGRVEMAVGPQLDGHLAEDVLGRAPPVHRPQGSGIETVIAQNVEPGRARVANPDERGVGARDGVGDERARIGDAPPLQVHAEVVVDPIPHHRSAQRAAELPGGEVARRVTGRVRPHQGAVGQESERRAVEPVAPRPGHRVHQPAGESGVAHVEGRGVHLDLLERLQ